MECPFYIDERNQMYTEFKNLEDETVNLILEEPQQVFYTSMG